MKFEHGHTKLGGRIKGTPNKKSRILEDVIESAGLNPVQKIAELLPSLNAKEQVDVYLDLMAYLYPKRKAVEHSMDPDQFNPEPLGLNELKELVRVARGESPKGSSR